MPASFNLPVAVSGVSAACSLSDQRDVPRLSPCDIGAFELPPTPPPPAVATTTTQPNLTALKLAPKKVRNGQKATVSFSLDIGAEVTFQLKRKVRRNGKVKLVKSGGAPKSFAAAAGSVKRTWRPRGLTPGSYQLLAIPTGGAMKMFDFKIVAKRG